MAVRFPASSGWRKDLNSVSLSTTCHFLRATNSVCSRRAAEQKNAAANARPQSTRAAGVGGSSGTMLKLYTDDVGRGFKVYVPPPFRWVDRC